MGGKRNARRSKMRSVSRYRVKILRAFPEEGEKGQGQQEEQQDSGQILKEWKYRMGKKRLEEKERREVQRECHETPVVQGEVPIGHRMTVCFRCRRATFHYHDRTIVREIQYG